MPVLLVSVLMLTCQPPLFVKSDFDQNYVYGTPEAATLTTILLLSIICEYFTNCKYFNQHIIVFNNLIVLGTIVCLVLHQRQKYKVMRQTFDSDSSRNSIQSTSKQLYVFCIKNI